MLTSYGVETALRPVPKPEALKIGSGSSDPVFAHHKSFCRNYIDALARLSRFPLSTDPSRAFKLSALKRSVWLPHQTDPVLHCCILHSKFLTPRKNQVPHLVSMRGEHTRPGLQALDVLPAVYLAVRLCCLLGVRALGGQRRPKNERQLADEDKGVLVGGGPVQAVQLQTEQSLAVR